MKRKITREGDAKQQERSNNVKFNHVLLICESVLLLSANHAVIILTINQKVSHEFDSADGIFY